MASVGGPPRTGRSECSGSPRPQRAAPGTAGDRAGCPAEPADAGRPAGSSPCAECRIPGRVAPPAPRAASPAPSWWCLRGSGTPPTLPCGSPAPVPGGPCPPSSAGSGSWQSPCVPSRSGRGGRGRASREERLGRFRSGGWSVETTIDPARQAAAQRAAERHASAIGAPRAAIAAVEPGTGRIRALVSRRPTELAQLQAGVGQPTPARQRLQAAGRRRRPGGRARPGQRLEGRNGVRFDLPRETWEVHNFGGGRPPQARPGDGAAGQREHGLRPARLRRGET